METRLKRGSWLACMGLFLGAATGAWGQTTVLTCLSSTAPFTPVISAEGRAEMVGDILVSCTGGTPTPAGSSVPRVTFTLFSPGDFTSNRLSGTYTEALLLVDEPNSPQNPSPDPLLNCGSSGAPASADACSIVSTGNSQHTYDGTPNGYGSGQVCDGSSGRPAAGSFACGRPNVFQARSGIVTVNGHFQQSRAIHFYNVPLDPPGDGVTRILRFTNLRVDATTLGVGLHGSGRVEINISVSGTTSIAMANSTVVTAFVAAGLRANPTAGSPVRLLEGFTDAWKTKNISFTVGNGATPGNATFAGTWQYNGGTNYPSDVAQNATGLPYRTQSGFQWQNNTTNAPPSPNPPAGFGAAVPGGGLPLSSATSQIHRAGVANAATRIALRFGNVPSGATIQVPPVVYLFPQGFNHNGDPAQFQTGASGVLVLTTTDSAGNGPFSPASGTLPSGSNLAVYEVLYSNTSQLEYADIPYTVNGGVVSGVTLSVGLAPFYAANDFNGPVPRFADRQAAQPCTGNPCMIGYPPGETLSPPSSQVQCSVNAGVPPIVRTEGLTEYLGDLVVICTGGIPTPAGQAVPKLDFVLNSVAPVTSEAVADGGFLEALLIVDEPNSASPPNRPVLNCGQTGAPDNGPNGAGVCNIVAGSDPAATYDGTPNGYGSFLCDGDGPRPAPNSFGCGRPNVFQGRRNPDSLANSVRFSGIPFDPPGAGNLRTLRITNVRVNPTLLPLSQGFNVTEAKVEVTTLGQVPISIQNAQQTAGYLQRGNQNVTSSASPIVLVEGFAPSWKPKNFSFLAGGSEGTPGNGTLPQPFEAYPQYNGATNYPPDIAQNVPGAIYNTESGFQWQNNSPNGPPSPNPPVGVGTVEVDDLGGPLGSQGFGGVNTGIHQAGVVDAGTRLAFRFTNIPAGATVEVPTQVAVNHAFSANITGVAVLTTTDANGAGPYSPRSGFLSAADPMAVYEILFSDPFTLERVEVAYTLTNAPEGTQLNVVASFAPFYSTTAAGESNAALPEPRFADKLVYTPCVNGPCISVVPAQGRTGESVQVAISGGPVLNGAQVELRATGQPTIPGTGVYNSNTNVLRANFALTGAAGPRDVVITPPGQLPFTLAGAFNVLPAIPCTYTVGPLNPSFGSAGGNGSLVVTPSATSCAWSATTATPWITLLPKQSNIQPYSLAANPDTAERSGTISIAGQTVNVTQAGACSYSISPGSGTFANAGGTMQVNVTAPAGCEWSAISNAGWIAVTQGASGSGNGWVTLTVTTVPAAARTGTVTIAGKTFNAAQSAPDCGAADVSNQVSITKGGMLSNFTGTRYTQQVRLTNTGGPLAGPVYLVVDGLPTSAAPCVGGPCAIVPAVPLTYCHSPNGSSLVSAAPAGMASGQVITLSLQFTPGRSIGGVPPTWYTTRVLNGTPTQ